MLRSIFFVSALTAASIFCLPSGHSVKKGKAKISNRGSEVVITSGKSAVIHWDQFSIGKDETAKFQMQDAKSTVLNRVTGGNKSEILGRMESNGKVYLMNPKGILFGQDCQINVGGLVASTLDILDQGGKLLFEGDSDAKVVNLGKISSPHGDVQLLAQKVENRGSIDAGRVGLAAGSKILIKPNGSERIFVKAGNGSIDHSGSIRAVLTELKTKSAYEMAINMNGLVKSAGGEVVVQGGKITFSAESQIDLSNTSGPGGVLKVGTSIHENFIQVEEGAKFFVSGKPGGEVRFKAKEMLFSGEVSARGMGESSGGFVEISASGGKFDLLQKIDCSSDAGAPGTVFHDPPAIIIDVSASSGPTTFGDSYISTTLAGSNLAITTTGPGFESITFVDGPGPGSPSISWSGDAIFTLTSGGTISATAPSTPTISNSLGSGGIDVMVFTANSGGTTSGNFTGIDFTPFTIEVDANNIVIDGTSGDTGGGATNIGVVTGDMTAFSTGNITITGTSVGAAGSAGNTGIRFTGTLATTSGNLIATGTGGVGTSGNLGISEAAFGGLSTVDGLIRLTGTGGAGTGGGNHGVEIPETTIMSTGAAFTSGSGIEIFGTGGSGSGSSFGVNFSDTPTSIESDANPILIVGIGGSGGMSNIGVSHTVEAEVFSTTTGSTGTVTYRGTGGSGTGDCVGVYIPIDNPTPVVYSDGSDISITGIGGPAATGVGNIGIDITDNVITAAINGGPGSVRLEGTGSSSGSAENHGIRMGSSGGDGTGVSALGGGDITLTGSGGAGSSLNHGVFLFFETEIIASTGEITITGTALGGTDDSDGVQITDSSTLIETSGAIGIRGESMAAGDRNRGVAIISDAIVRGVGSGSVSVTGSGGSGAIDNQGILIESSTVSTSSSSMIFNAMDDMLINAGGQIDGSSGLITVSTDGDLTILGTAPNTGIFPDTGGFTGSVGGDLTLIGSATGGAHVGSINPFGLTADITFVSIGGDVLVEATNTSGSTGLGYAVIGHGKTTGAPYSGNISLSDVGGSVTVQGANTATGVLNGVGQIGHIALADSDVLNGNITILARGNINVIGGVAGTNTYARIGHGGRPGIVFGTTSSEMTLIAGQNIAMTSQVAAGPAVITNPSTDSLDSLFLVVDNNNPTFPTFGAATFTVNAGSDLSMPNSSGELRIYTVQPSQNSVNELVNGAVYIPTPFNIDDATNQYNIYYPAGTFIANSSFRFYYKTGDSLINEVVPPFVRNRLFFLQVAEAQAEMQMPLFRGPYWHHPSFCGSKKSCDPGFDPYYSFIFEDDIYWKH
ncbi:MAG: filamentous hemagglutinin N-terminal domain-containing protein [Candidatus Algichlamydia australiensis]|nr:filamentous hemagglutinin N-terminal domain-containing protein [Chlamydiales bacterium]